MPEKSKTIMNTFHSKKIVILLSALALIWSSCVNDVWQEHYSNTDSNLGSESLTTSIKNRSDLTIFRQMMERTGYDSILNADQTYTVWAPSDAALAGFDLSTMDTLTMKEIVSNHIARFNYPTAGFNSVSTKKIFMQSGKFVSFDKSGSTFTFGSFSLDTANILAKNGILHVLNGVVPYASNVWESLGRIAGLDSVYAYLKPLGSTPFGDINNEDSVYTAILPNNTAWIQSYNRIKPYFKCLPSTTRDSSLAKQRRLTRNAIIQDAFFRGNIADPFSVDSLFNTSNHKFLNASRLFNGATAHKASNGYVWVSDSLRNTSTESWHNEIRIEAENTSYGRTSFNANVYWRSAENSGFNVSGNRYIVAYPLTTGNIQLVWVSFAIPNTLSAKYRIYCQFVPSAIQEVKKLPGLVKFFLEYTKADGTKFTSSAINAEVSGTAVSKIFVTEVTFPYCNILTNDNIGDISVRLKVQNAASTTQSTTYTRTMLIDCIILEPVI
jgi:uncharacterized surface protein with fasciclin (FAS1) repeats